MLHRVISGAATTVSLAGGDLATQSDRHLKGDQRFDHIIPEAHIIHERVTIVTEWQAHDSVPADVADSTKQKSGISASVPHQGSFDVESIGATQDFDSLWRREQARKAMARK